MNASAYVMLYRLFIGGSWIRWEFLEKCYFEVKLILQLTLILNMN